MNVVICWRRCYEYHVASIRVLRLQTLRHSRERTAKHLASNPISSTAQLFVLNSGELVHHRVSVYAGLTVPLRERPQR
jgi:hypothetical protein